MRLRLLLSLCVPVAAAVYFVHYNRGFVDLRLAPEWTVRLPLALVVLAAVLIGALVAALLGWGEAGIGALGRWRAGRRLRRRARAEERLAEAHRLRGRGRLRKARRAVRGALRNAPEMAEALRFAADLAAEAGDMDAAIRWNQRLRALSDDSSEALVRLSENLEAAGRLEDAERLLGRAGGNGKAHPAVIRRLRDLYAGAGRWEAALAASEGLARLGATEAERAADEDAAGRIGLSAAEGRMAAADPEGAAALLEQVVRRLPGDAAARIRLGRAQLAAGRLRRALRTWEAGYRQLGGAAFLREIAAAHAPLEGEATLRKAASALLAAGRARPDDPLPQVMASALLLEAGRTAEARKWLQAASEHGVSYDGGQPWAALVLRLLEARAKLEAGDRLAAESDFRKVAHEAGRLLLGAPPGGVVLKPHAAVADEEG